MKPPAWAPTLVGEGVTLRAHRLQDEADVVAQCRDPLTQRWTTVPVPYTEQHARDWINGRRDEWLRGNMYTFAIEEQGRFAGSLDLRRDGTAGMALGFGLAPWARGRQVTARALRAVLPWAFEVLQPEVVLWSAIAGNWASRRVAWSVGFRVEGTVRSLEEQRGVRLDGWIGSLRRGDPLRPAHPWFDPPVLSGSRVLMRRHRLDDVTAMAEACNDPVTQHWLPQLPQPYGTDDARAHLEEIAEEHAGGRAVFWALTDPGTDRMLGELGMWGLARGESRSAEVGYWTHPAARGRGMAAEAVRLATGFAFRRPQDGGLGLRRLVIRAAESNLPSQRVATGAGFAPAGRDRGAAELRDATVEDLLRYDLIAGEHE